MIVKLQLELDVEASGYRWDGDGDRLHVKYSPDDVAQAVLAAMYKTYANPLREDPGIRTVLKCDVV